MRGVKTGLSKSEYQRAYAAKHKERLRSYIRNYRLRRLYGLSKEDYDRMVDAQGGMCAICVRTTDALSVDHCHASGSVRGLLCQPCNMALGLFGDDPQVISAAADYVRSAS